MDLALLTLCTGEPLSTDNGLMQKKNVYHIVYSKKKNQPVSMKTIFCKYSLQTSRLTEEQQLMYSDKSSNHSLWAALKEKNWQTLHECVHVENRAENLNFHCVPSRQSCDILRATSDPIDVMAKLPKRTTSHLHPTTVGH